MPKFQYTARNLNGGRVSGQIEAEAVGAASRLLENRDLFPIDVWDVEDNESANSFRRRIASRDLGIMYGQLSDLLGSGVPLLRALKSLVKSTVNKRLTDVLRDIHNEVADGKSLHESMAGHQEIFPTLHTVMVQAGERAVVPLVQSRIPSNTMRIPRVLVRAGHRRQRQFARLVRSL